MLLKIVVPKTPVVRQEVRSHCPLAYIYISHCACLGWHSVGSLSSISTESGHETGARVASSAINWSGERCIAHCTDTTAGNTIANPRPTFNVHLPFFIADCDGSVSCITCRWFPQAVERHVKDAETVCERCSSRRWRRRSSEQVLNNYSGRKRMHIIRCIISAVAWRPSCSNST